MLHNMKFFLCVVVQAFIMSIFTACTDSFDEINTDPLNPEYVVSGAGRIWMKVSLILI